MSDIDRRQLLKGILGNLAQATGTVVLVSAVVSIAKSQGPQAQQSEESETPADNVVERADRLAATGDLGAEEAESGALEFLNGAFRNTPWGGFNNSPFGRFRNRPLLGGFANSPLGGFRNTPLGAFGNGGWPNGGWGGFNNGGWPNGAWHNWW
jgi:hypothetical protein